MNVAIVAMINQTALDMHENVTEKQPAYCLIEKNPAISNATAAPTTQKYVVSIYVLVFSFLCELCYLQVEGPYIWSTEQQGNILASFYYGYVCTQVAGGWLAGRIGGLALYPS